MTAVPGRQIPFGRPWMDDSDREAVLGVLNGHILTHGPEGKAFEEEFGAAMRNPAEPDEPGENIAHCVSVSSCMAALHLAYLHFGLGPGHEVLVPAQTHTATVHAVEWVGATPVFVDCDPATGNVTPEALERAITPRTRALSVVHFVGIPCDMPAMMAIAGRHRLMVVEDCAIAVGARFDGRHVGLFGDAGCFSFYPVKHITTGEGGMFVSKHRDVAAAVSRLRAFGVDRAHAERNVPGMYDVTTLGLNYRMSEMQAALGRSQLRRLPENLERRRANFTALKAAVSALPGLRVLDAVDPRAANSHYCASIVFDGALGSRRHDLIAQLNTRGIGTSIYYPHPVPRMTYYRQKYGYDAARFPGAEAVSDRSIALPVGPHITAGDVEYMVEALAACVTEVGVS